MGVAQEASADHLASDGDVAAGEPLLPEKDDMQMRETAVKPHTLEIEPDGTEAESDETEAQSDEAEVGSDETEARSDEPGVPEDGMEGLQGPATVEKERYFGSVKFFKNLILLVVILAILTPTCLCVAIWRKGEAQNAQWQAHASRLQSEKEQLQAQYDAMQAEKTAKEAIWAGSVADMVVQSEPLAYQSLYPDFYVTEPMGEAAQDEGTIYLTFDDGPSSNTPLLLKVLKNKDVKATFFVVGGDTERQRQWMRDIVDGGHTLAMHSYSHNYRVIYESVEAFLDDYYKLYTNIKEATGAAPTIFRFPGGSVNSYNYTVYREIIAEMLRRGFVFYDWNLSSGDASSNYVSPKRIISNVLDHAPDYSRGIVLFHDAPSKDSTVESLAYVIDGLEEQGFKFAPLSREVRPILFNYCDYQPD